MKSGRGEIWTLISFCKDRSRSLLGNSALRVQSPLQRISIPQPDMHEMFAAAALTSPHVQTFVL